MEGLIFGILRCVLAITIQQKMWPKMSQQQIDNLHDDGILLLQLEHFGVLLSFLLRRFSVLSNAHIYLKISCLFLSSFSKRFKKKE